MKETICKHCSTDIKDRITVHCKICNKEYQTKNIGSVNIFNLVHPRRSLFDPNREGSIKMCYEPEHFCKCMSDPKNILGVLIHNCPNKPEVK